MTAHAKAASPLTLPRIAAIWVALWLVYLVVAQPFQTFIPA
ncbi:MAG: hypothetical protein ACOH1M_07805 [Rhodoglobus sp.]